MVYNGLFAMCTRPVMVVNAVEDEKFRGKFHEFFTMLFAQAERTELYAHQCHG